MTDPIPTPPADEPTADEIAAALAVLDRGQEVLMSKLRAAAPKVQELVQMGGYPAILAKAMELRGEIAPDQPFYAHLSAMVQGMTGIQADIARAAPAPAA